MNLGAELLGCMLHNGKAQTGTAGFPGMTLIHTVEPFKDASVVPLGNTNAGILNNDAAPLHGHGYLATVFVVPNGIVAEVVDQLVSQLPNAGDHNLIAKQFHCDISLICRREQCLQDLGANLIQLHIFLGILTAFI